MMCTYVLRRSGRDWTFVLVDESGKPLVRGKLHASRAFALRAIEEIRAVGRTARAFERTTTEGGLFAFGIAAADGRRLAASSFFASSDNRDATLYRCRDACADAPIAEDAALFSDHPDHAHPLARRHHHSHPHPHPHAAAGSGAAIRLETSDDGYRLVLFDASDRWLLGTPRKRLVSEAVEILEDFRCCAADDALYEKLTTESGAHAFRLLTPAGDELAQSPPFRTTRERDDRLARTKSAAYQVAQTLRAQS